MLSTSVMMSTLSMASRAWCISAKASSGVPIVFLQWFKMVIVAPRTSFLLSPTALWIWYEGTFNFAPNTCASDLSVIRFATSSCMMQVNEPCCWNRNTICTKVADLSFIGPKVRPCLLTCLWTTVFAGKVGSRESRMCLMGASLSWIEPQHSIQSNLCFCCTLLQAS